MATEYIVKAHGMEQVRSTNRAKMISRADDMLRAAIDGKLAVTITVETVKTGKIVYTAVSAPEIVKGSRVTVDGRTGNVVDIDRIYCEAAVLFDGATDGHEWWKFAEGMELVPSDAAQDAETAALALVPAYEQDAETDTLTVDGIAYAVTVNRAMTHQHSREIMLTAYSTEHPAGFSFRCPRDTADPFNARFYNVANRDGGIDHPTTLADTIRLIAGRLPSLRTPAAPVDVCPNCTQTHPVEDAELHGAPCFVCASDGHAGCQHGDDAPAALVPDAFDDSTHVIRFVGDDVTMCGELVRGKHTTLRVSVDPTDANCAECLAAERHTAAQDAHEGPTDDETHTAIVGALTAAQSAPVELTAEQTAVYDAHRIAPDDRRADGRVTVPGLPGVVVDLGPTVLVSQTPSGKLRATIGGMSKEFRNDRSARLHVSMWVHMRGYRPAAGGTQFQWVKSGGILAAPARLI